MARRRETLDATAASRVGYTGGRPPVVTAFGRLLRDFRQRGGLGGRRLSIRELAKRVGVNHTYLSALETGRRPRASEELLARLCTALQLSPDDRERLRLAAFGSSPLVAPGVVVEPGACIARQSQADVASVWIAAERPLELDDRWLPEVAANIMRGIRYVYLVAQPHIWDTLVARFEHRGPVRGQVLEERVTCVHVADPLLATFMFRPPFILIHLRSGEVIGVWAHISSYQSGDPERFGTIESVAQMDAATAMDFKAKLRDVIDAARAAMRSHDRPPGALRLLPYPARERKKAKAARA